MDTAENRNRFDEASRLYANAAVVHANIVQNLMGQEGIATGLGFLRNAFNILDSIHDLSPPPLSRKRSPPMLTPVGFKRQKMQLCAAAAELQGLFNILEENYQRNDPSRNSRPFL